MLDAEWYRIRRKLIPMSREISRDEHGISHPYRPRCGWSERHVADALAAIAILRGRIIRCAIAMLRMRRLVPTAAIAEDANPACHEDKYGDDGHEQAGAEKTQEAGR
jgi:hypothetical protein